MLCNGGAIVTVVLYDTVREEVEVLRGKYSRERMGRMEERLRRAG